MYYVAGKACIGLSDSESEVMFLPQKPHLTIGSLADQVCLALLISFFFLKSCNLLLYCNVIILCTTFVFFTLSGDISFTT